MMTILDTFGAMPACFPGGRFSLPAWRAYAAQISPELPDKCEADISKYDFDRDVAPVLSLLPARPGKAKQAHEAFLRRTRDLEERFCWALGSAPEATILFYVGLCCAAGWATELEGRPAVLLGLEKMIELDWCDDTAMAGLIDHELGHLWHFQHRAATDFADPRLWQLYTEGMAMWAEQKLCGDEDFFHQGKNGWLTFCRANRKALMAEYRRRVSAGESVQDFFGDWCSYQGHSDVGYYLGSVLIWQLSRDRTPEELASLDEAAFRAALEDA